MNPLRKFGNALIVFGVILMVGATILFMYNIDKDGDVGKQTSKIVSALSDAINEREDGIPKTEDEIRSILRDGTDVIYVDGVPYIGFLTVPSQSLELPILSECSLDLLKTAPCRYSGSAYTDDLVLAGHNYRSHFGKLNNLSVGDTIRFTNVYGSVTEYRVAELQVLRPTAVESMKNSPYDLSLFTCNMAGNARFTVRCKRAD